MFTFSLLLVVISSRSRLDARSSASYLQYLVLPFISDD